MKRKTNLNKLSLFLKSHMFELLFLVSNKSYFCRMKGLKLCLVFVLSTLVLIGQQNYGLEIVKELCSPKFEGRGYVNDGHIKAANFIKDKFVEYGLKPIKGQKDYFQHFKMNVNSFPDSVSLSLNGKKLETGVDFVVDASSGSAVGSFTPVYITNKDELFEFEYSSPENRSKSIVVIVDPQSKNIDSNAMFREFKYKCANLAPVIWITEAKYTWTVGRQAFDFPIFELHSEHLPKELEEVSLNVKNEFKPKLKTQNVIGKIEGTNKKKTIVITAHYDHLGRMGADTYFPGANDNASGVAMMLYLAKYYSENPPKCNVVFMAFGGEEVGILGSRHYVSNPLFPLEEIRFLINLDILGTGEEGITVVNGAVYKKQFKKLAKINVKKQYLAKVKVRGKAANSDHYFFSEAGVPSIFIYTMGGVSFYHDVLDKSETLPLNEFDDLAKLLIDFVGKL
ncbi:MAG: aminopeptidase YwaD [Flavobacteriales bacterium]